MNSDDPELDRVRAAVSDEADGSDDLVDMLMVGFDLTFASDCLVADIVQDSAADELTAVRSARFVSRFITCGVGDDRFELEVGDGEVIGSVEPPRAGSVTLHQAAHVSAADVSDSGAFSVALVSTAPFRLVFVDGTGAAISTVWILP